MSKGEVIINLQGRVDGILVLDLVHGLKTSSSKALSPPEGLEEANVEVGEMGGWDDDHEEIIKEISLINGKQFTNFREMYFDVECSTAPTQGGGGSTIHRPPKHKKL